MTHCDEDEAYWDERPREIVEQAPEPEAKP